MVNNIVDPDKIIHFHIHGKGVPLTPGANASSLTTAIFARFYQILEGYKKGMVNGKSQVDFLNQLSGSVSTLMTLVTRVMGGKLTPAQADQLGTEISTQIASIDKEIGQLSPSTYKDQLTTAFSTIKTFFGSGTRVGLLSNLLKDIQAIFQWRKDLQNNHFSDWGTLVKDNSIYIDDAKKLDSILNGLSKDLPAFKNLVSQIQKIPGVDPSLATQLSIMENDADDAYNSLMKVNANGVALAQAWTATEGNNSTDPNKKYGKMTSWISYFVSLKAEDGGSRLAKKGSLHGWLDPKKNNGAVNFMQGFLNAGATYPCVVPAKDKIIILNTAYQEQSAGNDGFENGLTAIRSEYEAAVGAVNQMSSAGGTLGNDETATLQSQMTAAQTILQMWAKFEQVPMGRVGFAESRILS